MMPKLYEPKLDWWEPLTEPSFGCWEIVGTLAQRLGENVTKAKDTILYWALIAAGEPAPLWPDGLKGRLHEVSISFRDPIRYFYLDDKCIAVITDNYPTGDYRNIRLSFKYWALPLPSVSDAVQGDLV